jgi:hypothetical protein
MHSMRHTKASLIYKRTKTTDPTTLGFARLKRRSFSLKIVASPTPH